MKYLDGCRDPRATSALLDRIRETVTRRWTVAEVCGGQTQALLRFRAEGGLPAEVELRHGPGCPVAATSPETIDRAVELAARPGLIFCTSDDLLRVPGRRGGCLDDVRGGPGDVRVVYSALDALALARQNPDRPVVFLAVGFETTAPTAAAAVLEADRLGLANFAILAAHRRLAPAVGALLDAHGGGVNAVLTAGHVATVAGLADYEAIAHRHGVPVVVTGPEPLDALDGLLRALTRLERGESGVENQYARAVRPEGNVSARAAIAAVFEPAAASWPGLGRVAESALVVRERYNRFDALTRFPELRSMAPVDVCGGSCGAVIAARMTPTGCAEFHSGCSPDSPRGAPMASPEGACAAYFRNRRRPRTPTVPTEVKVGGPWTAIGGN